MTGNGSYQELFQGDRVHRRVYTDPTIFDAEMQRIFGRTWIFIGHESEIRNPGDFKTDLLGKRPIILVRGKDGRVSGVVVVDVEWKKDAAGRFGPQEVAGSERTLPASLVLIAMGFLGPERYMLEQLGVGELVLEKIGLKSRQKPDMKPWQKLIAEVQKPRPPVRIALVGKYVELQDAYMSVREALKHAALANSVEVEIGWVHSADLEKDKEKALQLGAHSYLVKTPLYEGVVELVQRMFSAPSTSDLGLLAFQEQTECNHHEQAAD